MNYAWVLRASYETSFNGWSAAWTELEGTYLPTDCMMSRSMGAAKSGLRWMNMERTITARARVSSSYSSSTAAQSRHLQNIIFFFKKRVGFGIQMTRLHGVTEWFIHRSDMVVGCSSMNSSGAGTNMLTVLGAERRLVFVGPAKDKQNNVFLICHHPAIGQQLYYFILFYFYWPVSQVQMLCGALDWCSSCLFISWLIVRAPREPRFTWRYWAKGQTQNMLNYILYQ